MQEPLRQSNMNNLDGSNNFGSEDLKRQTINYRYTIENEDDFRSVNGAFWEFLGTLLIMYGYLMAQAVVVNGKLLPEPFGVAIAVSFATAFGIQQTGAHYNPAISVNFLLEGRINIVQFISYVIAQISGAIAGGMLYYVLTFDDANSFITTQDANYSQVNSAGIRAQYFFSEFIGTFVLCLFYNIQTHSYCRLTNDYFLIAFDFCCVILTARTMAVNSGGIINPAIAIAITLCSGFGNYNTKWLGANILWIYIIAPVLSAALCFAFFKFFYAPLYLKLSRLK